MSEKVEFTLNTIFIYNVSASFPIDHKTSLHHAPID